MKLRFLGPLISIALLLLTVMLAPRSTSGAEQNADMDLLASRVVEKLKKGNIKIVAVSRFYHEKKGGHRALSDQLSDTFTSTLANAAGDIRILDRARLLKASQEKKWMAIDFDDPPVFNSIAVASKADAVIQGTVKLEGKFLELSLKVVNLSTEKKIAEVKTKISIPPGIDDNSLDGPVQDLVTGVYLAGPGGVKAPTCNYCPEPEFSPEARQKHVWEAKNLFRITVRADGGTADIRLVKPAGYGLDENSAAALQHWQLTPARLPNGTVVPSRVDIEISYHH